MKKRNVVIALIIVVIMIVLAVLLGWRSGSTSQAAGLSPLEKVTQFFTQTVANVGDFLSGNKRANDNQPVNNSDTSTFNWSGLEQNDDLLIAKNIADWADKDMRDGRGAYNAIYNCAYDLDQSKTVCDNGSSSNRTGASMIWLNYLLWRKTGDANILKRLQDDLTLYSNRAVINIIQTDELSCYFMTAMAADGNLSETDRSNAQKICLDTEYEIESFEEIDRLFGTNILEAYQQDVVTLATDIMNGTAQNQANAALGNRWNTWATDYVAHYRIDQDSGFLRDAYKYFAGALAYYGSGEGGNSLNYGCELLLTSSEFCELANDNNDVSCQLKNWLGGQLRQRSIADGSPDLGALAKCAIADTSNRAHYADFLRSYYQSDDNDSAQTIDARLLNDYQGETKYVTTNALFAGALIFGLD